MLIDWKYSIFVRNFSICSIWVGSVRVGKLQVYRSRSFGAHSQQPTSVISQHKLLLLRRLTKLCNYNSHKSIMSTETDAVASATIELLEGRLHRLEYLLTGETTWTGQPSAAPKTDSLDDTVARRLNHLESTLNSLSKSNPAVRDVLQLCKPTLIQIVSLCLLFANQNKSRLPVPRSIPRNDIHQQRYHTRRSNDPKPRFNRLIICHRIP